MNFIKELRLLLSKASPSDNTIEFIILSDSLKNTCCDDNILAERVNGELLIKIGSSCHTESFGQCKIKH